MLDLTPSSRIVVDVRNVQKGFGEGANRVAVLKDVSIEARTGEIMMLVGPSGCGKTTLLSAIAGTLQIESGTINVFGNELEKMSGSALTRFRAANIGFIFQQFNLIPTLTLAENVGVPLLIQGISSSKALKRSREILDKVGLGERWSERPNKLSGGQQQRVAIARALVHEPPLVICDEPHGRWRDCRRERTNLAATTIRPRTLPLISHEPFLKNNPLRFHRLGYVRRDRHRHGLTHTGRASVASTKRSTSDAATKTLPGVCRSIRNSGGTQRECLDWGASAWVGH